MSIAAIKRWHWALIGLALGLVVSLWLGWVGPESALIDRPTLEAVDFERLILEKAPSGRPMVKDVRVHSVVDGTYWLTAQQLFRDESVVKVAGKSPNAVRESYVAVKIPAKTPFVPKSNPPPKGAANYTVVDWLTAMKAKNPQIGFSTRWWAREPARTPIFALAGMLLLAGLCPGIMHMMYGPQLEAAAKQAEEEKKKAAEYDLARFGKGKPEAGKPGKPGKPQITEEVIAHVRELDQELERRLVASHGGGQPSPAASDAAGAANSAKQGDQPIRKLDAGPLEASSDDHAHKKHKRFGGEFYPTETHVKQDDDA